MAKEEKENKAHTKTPRDFAVKKIVKSKLVNFAKMANSKVRDFIAIFYKLNHKEGNNYDHFKNSGMSKADIYKFLARFDERIMLIANARLVAPRLCPKETNMD